jgi:1,4-dihydroxy-2-naphthoyl-CoA hydrolase
MVDPHPADATGKAHSHSGFDSLVGLQILEAGPDRVVGELLVRPELLQPFGILHGGVLCTLVETIGSVGGGLWYGERGQAVGVSNATDFLRAVRADARLSVVGLPVHQDDSQQLWEVTVSEGEKPVARGLLRLANIDSIANIGGGRTR